METISNLFFGAQEIVGTVSFIVSIALSIWNTKLSKRSREQAKELKQMKEKSDVLLKCLVGTSDLTYQINGGDVISVDNLTPDQVEEAATEQRVLRDFQARNGRIFADKVVRESSSHFQLTVDPTKLQKK